MTDILSDNFEVPLEDPNKDYYSELVGENKKFKTPQDLARAKQRSDDYIRILERRLDAQRDDYESLHNDYKTTAKLQELLDQMANRHTSSEQPPAKDDNNKPSFDPKQLDVLVSNKIQEHETTKRYTDNANFVRDRIVQNYGSNYSEVINRQINELGLTRDEFNEMARKQPKVLLKTLGLDEQIKTDPFRAPPVSQQRSNATGPAVQKRTWSYYQDLRKKDPKLWLSKEIAVQMHNDAIALGDEFRDADYYAHGHT